MNNTVGYQGDLLSLSLVEGTILNDEALISQSLAMLGVDTETPVVLGALRALTNALTATLLVNLDRETALQQIELWRGVMTARIRNENL